MLLLESGHTNVDGVLRGEGTVTVRATAVVTGDVNVAKMVMMSGVLHTPKVYMHAWTTRTHLRFCITYHL